jgi:hypothetical protein
MCDRNAELANGRELVRDCKRTACHFKEAIEVSRRDTEL